MKCKDCKHYRQSLNYNSCAVVEAECFIPRENCDLVNDDGTLNKGHPYYRTPEGSDENHIFLFEYQQLKVEVEG